MKKTSVIIPSRELSNCMLYEAIPILRNQENFLELIIIVEHLNYNLTLPSFVKIIQEKKFGPAVKRDIGVKKAKGQIIAFIDDDVYPGKNWLSSALKNFADPRISAVCGPGITPNSDDLKQQTSGFFWSSWLGVGGAAFRCQPGKKRFIDDYPSFNLLVRKMDFLAVGGFKSDDWPGEDTRLCHKLVYKLGKKIIYDPKVIVFHHRRPILRKHLEQISRYGFQRGVFVKVLPKTSLRIGYFFPFLFITFLIFFPLIILIFNLNNSFWWKIYFSLIVLYLIMMFINSLWVIKKSKKWRLGFLVLPTTFFSHIVYGIKFGQGLFSPFKSKNLRQLV